MSDLPDSNPMMVAADGGVEPTPRRLWQRPLVLGLLLPMILFIVQAIVLWNFSIDDVGISYRYARHLAEGHGLTWNLHEPPVEGYSNFLWVLVLAAGKWLRFDIETTSKVLGLALGGLNLALLFTILRRIWSESRYSWFPVLLVALTPQWVMWTMSGLEIGLFGAWLLMSILALTGRGRESALLLSLGLAGLILTRPEGLALAAILLFAAFLADREAPWRQRVAKFRLPIIAVLGASFGLEIFRLLYYGYPLPNTVYAKFSLAFPGLPETAGWMIYGVPFWMAWGVAWWHRRQLPHRWLLGACLALVVGQMLITLPVVPVMSFLHRYHVAFLPLAVLPIPFAVEYLSRRSRWSGVLAILALLGWSLQSWPSVKERLAAEEYSRQVQQCVVGQLSTLPGRPTVAIVDAGRIPYWCDLPTIDVWGLCDREIARRGFSAKAIMEKSPEVYVTSVDVIAPGVEKARLGMDQLMMNEPQFIGRYLLWQSCLGGTTTKFWRYDYAILLNAAWAKRQGIELRPVQ